MLQPDIGQLLKGARSALAESVLPKVDDANAKRQLKAIMHMIGRLSRSWDLPHRLIHADNEDMASVLATLRSRITAAGFEQVADIEKDADFRVASLESDGSGINDPQLAADTSTNRSLRRSVEALEQYIRSYLPAELKQSCLAELHQLFIRMTARESVMLGDVAPDPIAPAVKMASDLGSERGVRNG